MTLEQLEPKGAPAQAPVLAMIATLGVVDRDGDLILPGGLVEHEHPIIVSEWNHSSLPRFGGRPPVGSAKIFEVANMIFAEVAYDDTPQAKAACARVERDRPDWSPGFLPLKERPPTPAEAALGAKNVIEKWAIGEVSPASKGAGVGTGTHRACCNSCATGAKCADEVVEEVKATLSELDDQKALRGLASHIGNLLQKSAPPAKAAEAPAAEQKADTPAAAPAPAADPQTAPAAPVWQVEALRERLHRINANKSARGVGSNG